MEEIQQERLKLINAEETRKMWRNNFFEHNFEARTMSKFNIFSKAPLSTENLRKSKKDLKWRLSEFKAKFCKRGRALKLKSLVLLYNALEKVQFSNIFFPISQWILF